MKQFIYVFILCSCFVACKKHPMKVYNAEVFKEVAKVKCDLQNAEKAVLELDEVRERDRFIDSLSHHKKRIEFLSDSTMIDGNVFYEIEVGYNSEMRFETYYTFYIEKGKCNNIKVLDTIEGDTITLSKWRKRMASLDI